jgi:tetratricopeptide repeat protein 8
MLDDHKISNAPRPGTSLQRAGTSGKGTSPLVRPQSSSGRPLSGVVRPGTQNQRQGTSRLQTSSNRINTSRVTTTGGRQVRIATATLQSLNSSLSLNVNDIIPKNIVKKKSLAKAVTDYLFYVEKNYKKVLEICCEATIYSNYTDWWWKFKLGKVYYKLGMLAESEKQLLSAIKQNNNVNCVLQLSHLYIKMDQPMKSLEILSKAASENYGEIYYNIYQARIQEMLSDYEESMLLYKGVLGLDNCNFEAIACIGSHHFYSDHPEVALKFYKRLFELGITSADVWNNLGLCAYYSGQ